MPIGRAANCKRNRYHVMQNRSRRTNIFSTEPGAVEGLTWWFNRSEESFFVAETRIFFRNGRKNYTHTQSIFGTWLNIKLVFLFQELTHGCS